MKKYLFIVLLVGLALGQNSNPCEDERFLKIKEKSLEDMTDREYEFFMKKDKECIDYNANKGQTVSNETKIDYTDFLISLGCQYDDNGVLNYYNIDSKVWIKIDNQLSFLESLGYREGSTINGIKGEIYKYNSGRWVKQKLNRNNPTTVKSKNKSLPIQSTSSSNGSIHFFPNYDLSGSFESEESEEDVKNEISLGLDLMLFGNDGVFLGVGAEYQLERKLDVDGSEGDFYFIPAYLVLRTKSQQANIIGKVGLSYFFADKDFTGESISNLFRAKLKENLYYAAGISILITNNISLQALWSRSSAEVIYEELDTSVDVSYDKISVGFSLYAEN